jgi:hypothetical protein
MDDPFEGNWSELQCGGSPDVKPMLEKAMVMISSQEDRQVTWKFTDAPAPVSASVKSDHDRLSGEFQVGDARYYYEIVARTPPLPFQKPSCLYGIVCKILVPQGPGGELGHPGTWVAEESGKAPLG